MFALLVGRGGVGFLNMKKKPRIFLPVVLLRKRLDRVYIHSYNWNEIKNQKHRAKWQSKSFK